MTPAVTVHGAGLVDPFSNPAFPIDCWAVVTVRFMFVVCVCPPPVPVTVMLYVPGGVEDAKASVRFDVPFPGATIEAGANVAVAPVGKPVADKATAELKPVLIVEVMVAVPESPRAIVIDWDDEDRAKSALKTMSRIGCNSMPFGAMPSCPSL